MSTSDPYGPTDRADDNILEAIVTRLEARRHHPLFAQMMHDYLDAMPIESAQTVLDLGCGTGVVARTIASRQGFHGHVTGIDLSPYLIEVGARLAAEEGVEDRVSFQTGDSLGLDLPDASFDAVVAHTLMNHVDDPLAVIQEIVRVLKPGGRIAVFDSDFSTLAFSHAGPEEAKAVDDAIIRALVTNPRIMRQMPQVFRAAGLELLAAFPYVLADIGQAAYWLDSIESYRRLIPQGGTMSPAEANAWADARLQESAVGIVFGACNFYSYVAKRL